MRPCGRCCCRPWWRASRPAAGRWCWSIRRTSRFCPRSRRRGSPPHPCCGCAAKRRWRHCGPASRRCAAPTWPPCWPGCRARAPALCAACTRRPQAAGAAGSCARLRLRVGGPAAAPVHGAGHPDAARQALAPALCVDILKRRGPPLDAPLQLPAQAPRLRALLAASAPAGAAGPGGGKVRSLDTKKEESHALDRLAVAA